MTLLAAIEAYVRLKQSLGAVFSTDQRILRSFGRTLGDLLVDAISAEACLAFCQGAGPATRFGERKHQTLRGFFAYLRARGHLPASPLREPGPRPGRGFRPYIYSHDELRCLLDATAILAEERHVSRSPQCHRHPDVPDDDAGVARRGVTALRALRRDRRGGACMTKTHPLGSFVHRFLLEDVVADRNLSLNTQKSYRDTLRLLFGYLTDHHATDPTRVTVELVTAEVIRGFLAPLEQQRHSAVATRNQRRKRDDVRPEACSATTCEG
jgi:hypothetical protein